MTGKNSDIEYDYFPLEISKEHFIVYKVDIFHFKEPTKTYVIKMWGGAMHCDCPAGGRCKHLQMIQPKKDLF